MDKLDNYINDEVEASQKKIQTISNKLATKVNLDELVKVQA